MSLADPEFAVLRQLWHHFGVPDGQWSRCPEVVVMFADAFNAATGLDFTNEEVHRLVMNRRKRRRDQPQRLNALIEYRTLVRSSRDMLTVEQWDALDRAYVLYDVPSDEVIVSVRHQAELGRRFAELTGVVLPNGMVAAAIQKLRKDGDLTRIRDDHEGRDEENEVNFNDFDEAEGM